MNNNIELNFSFDDFIKEENMLDISDAQQLKKFKEELAKIKESYIKEMMLIDQGCQESINEILSLLPIGNYPIQMKTFLSTHIYYIENLTLKAKLAQRSRCFDKVHHVHTSIVVENKSKKRKEDVFLNQWYDESSANKYPDQQQKDILASRCKISKNKLEEWFGNKRTRESKKKKVQKTR
ncbi:hypothetical protein CYY_001080 [Polysphondylium violaceum]|uniref:Homeobox domain-containing protein n=1 Tax=Polysphondylium violaceum TaxID=133409 RepID=A0A8J4Q2L4_9MYCE|nr:hypothetical protein CYY_001080 [Polysphondylium violaceum]